MSKQNYSEVEPTDSEIEDYLDDIYYEDVEVCGYSFRQSYILKHMDRTAFNMAGNNIEKFKCGICDTIYFGENEAMNCCQKECSECGAYLDDDFEGELCEDCQAEEDDEGENSEETE